MHNTTKRADLQEILNRNIKDVIAAHPAVGVILSEFDIACVTCAAGNCLFKDIVDIHSLSQEQQAAMFARVAEAIFPGQEVNLPAPARKEPSRAARRKSSPPIQELMDEHTCIKRVLAAIPPFAASLGAHMNEAAKQTTREIVDFIRNFADRYHHAKEEDLLFRHFDANEPIILAMHREHEGGRAYARAAAEGAERNDAESVRRNLAAYGELLAEHIRKEDEILYPWMDEQLSDSQIGRLFAEFRGVDDKFAGRPDFYRRWAVGFAGSYNKQTRSAQ